MDFEGPEEQEDKRSGHDGHLTNCLEGMDDILQGGRDDLSGYTGRAGFTTFARIFTGSFLCVVFLCLLVFCLFFVLFACF